MALIGDWYNRHSKLIDDNNKLYLLVTRYKAEYFAIKQCTIKKKELEEEMHGDVKIGI